MLGAIYLSQTLKLKCYLPITYLSCNLQESHVIEYGTLTALIEKPSCHPNIRISFCIAITYHYVFVDYYIYHRRPFRSLSVVKRSTINPTKLWKEIIERLRVIRQGKSRFLETMRSAGESSQQRKSTNEEKKIWQMMTFLDCSHWKT